MHFRELKGVVLPKNEYPANIHHVIPNLYNFLSQKKEVVV